MAAKRIPPEERAPLFGSWRGWYVLVLVVLALCMGAFYWFTKHFS